MYLRAIVNPKINKLFRNILWALSGVFLGIGGYIWGIYLTVYGDSPPGASLAAISAGILAKRDEFPYWQIERIRLLLPKAREEQELAEKKIREKEERLLRVGVIGNDEVAGHDEAPCSNLVGRSSTMVAVTMGQSNAANTGLVLHKSVKNVFNYNWFNGKCYVAADPLLGATGTGGSVWTLFGSAVVKKGLYRNVVLAPIAVGATAIDDWKPGGRHHYRVIKVLKDLREHGFKVTHILWHQGEADALGGTSMENYRQALLGLIRSIRGEEADAPIYIAVATLCFHTRDMMIRHRIRDAQRSVVNPKDGIVQGPDTDLIDGIDDRFDGCHFSDEGMVKHANAWVRAVTSGRAAHAQFDAK